MSSRVLLIAHGSGTLPVLGRLLCLNGFEVIPADSLKTVLELPSNDTPHCALVDIGLPDDSGPRLLRELSKLGIRGVALSANCDAEYVALCRAAGFYHLLKPVAFHHLLSLLESTACAAAGEVKK
jgi:DNA-binding response OmpR family regulator